jgi:two-component system, NarL family, sensor kinase
LLHPPLLDELGLECAVRWYLEGLTKRSGIETSLEITPSRFPRLLPQLENAIYRIIQEALTNAFRHSGTTRVAVALRKKGDFVSLAVRDFGKGIPEDIAAFRPGTLGVGVGGMRQRVKEFGGELRLAKADPGTLVEVVIPYAAVETPPLLVASL